MLTEVERSQPILISGIDRQSSNNLLWVFLGYFFDGNHAFLVEVMSSIHNAICSMSKWHTIASLVNIIRILIHSNIRQNKLSFTVTRFYCILHLELMTTTVPEGVFKPHFQTSLFNLTLNH